MVEEECYTCPTIKALLAPILQSSTSQDPTDPGVNNSQGASMVLLTPIRSRAIPLFNLDYSDMESCRHKLNTEFFLKEMITEHQALH